MEVPEAKRLRELEAKNARLKKLLAESALDNAALKELLSRSGNPRSEAACGKASGDGGRLSQRSACRLLGLSRSAARYQAILRDDALLRARLQALATYSSRYGYLLRALLGQEGLVINRKPPLPALCEHDREVRTRRRKRPMRPKAPMSPPDRPNQR